MTTPVGDFCPKGFDAYPLALGDVLRGERATVGKSLEDVQADIRIGVKYIAAIEAGDLSAFDTKGFVAGYVRSYARYLNLDGDKAYIQFCQETGFENITINISNRKSAKHKYNVQGAAKTHNKITMGSIDLPTQRWYETISFSAIGSIVVLLALLSALAYGGWKVVQEVQRVQFAPVNEVPGVASDVSILADGGALDEAGPVLGSPASSGVSITPIASLDQLYRPQELDLPSVISRDGPISTINPENLGTYAPDNSLVISAVTQTDGPVATISQGPSNLDIVATRPAWVRIYLPDNSVLFEKILNAGERYRLPTGAQSALLKAGNSGAVYVMIGEKTFGPVGARGSVAREISLLQSDVEKNYGEVLNLFSEPLAPPLNTSQDLTAEAILNDLQNN